jgi:hypothetical protein
MERANRSAALNEREDSALTSRADVAALGRRRQILVARATVLNLAEVGFIRLNDLASATKRRRSFKPPARMASRMR